MCIFCSEGDAARLYVHSAKGSEFSQISARLLDDCLQKVSGSPTRVSLKTKEERIGETLQSLQKAKGAQGFLQKGLGSTVEGSLSNFPMVAVGVGWNKTDAKQSFFLAMSLVIMLHLKPSECEGICIVWGVQDLVKKAHHLIKQEPSLTSLLENNKNFKGSLSWQQKKPQNQGPALEYDQQPRKYEQERPLVEAPPGLEAEKASDHGGHGGHGGHDGHGHRLSFDVKGHCFHIVSDQPCFMQGRCTTPESYKALAWVQDHLKSQESLFVSFQGEMMGHEGEIYFAVIKPIDLFEWSWNREVEQTEVVLNTTSTQSTEPEGAGQSGHGQGSSHHGFVLDLECPDNVELLKQLLANPKILKAHRWTVTKH